MSGGIGNITAAIGKGRPRKPSAQRALRRAGARGRASPGEPRPPVEGIPPAPRGLSPVGRRAWEDLRATIDPLRTAAAVDMIAFETLVDALTVAREAALAFRKNGVTLTEVGVKGSVYVRPRPEVNVLLSAQKLVWYGLSRFGCSPADRSRVTAAPELLPSRAKEAEFGLREPLKIVLPSPPPVRRSR